MREATLTDPDGVLVLPDGEPRGALLVLGGSSGRVMTDRCRVLAGHGYAALSVRWLADPAAGLTEHPVEWFAPYADRLAGLGPRLGVVGTSFGAVAALLLGVADPRLGLVVGLAPSHVVWGSSAMAPDGRPGPGSSFTWRGDPLHFVPYIDQSTWTGPALQSPRQLYEASLRAHAARIPAARVVVEDITARLVLAAGGADAVWPAAAFADEVRTRRAEHGLATTVLYEADAGHRVVLPGEVPLRSVSSYSYGGTEEADCRLGARVLAAVEDTWP